MTNKNRKEKVSKHKKILEDNINKSDQLLENLKDDIENKKKVCTNVENIKQSQEVRLKNFGIYNEYVDNLTEEQWRSFSGSFQYDASLNKDFEYLNKESKIQLKFDTEAISSTGSAATISGQSSPTDYIIFEPLLKEEEKQEIEKIDLESIQRQNIAEIYNLLSIFDDSFAEDFISIVNDWDGTPDDSKFNILLNLRSFIFDKFLKSLDPDDDYIKTSWFGNYKGMPDKKTFTKVRYFIMGCTDEHALTPFSTADIDSVSEALGKAFHELSKYGKKGGDILLIKSTFQYTLTFFKAALELRDPYNDIIG